MDGATLSRIAQGRRIPTLNTIDQALRATRHQLITIPTRGATAVSTGAAIRSFIDTGRSQDALRAFIQYNDDLAREEGALRVALTIGEPAPTGALRWDAALAALADHHLSRDSLPKSSWIDDPSRRLAEEWVFDGTEYSAEHDRGVTPRAFRERGIVLNPDELASI